MTTLNSRQQSDLHGKHDPYATTAQRGIDALLFGISAAIVLLVLFTATH